MLNKKFLWVFVIVLLLFVLAIFLISLKGKESDFDPSPSINLDLLTSGSYAVAEELLISLNINPSADLGEEFFNTPARVEFVFPSSFEILEGDKIQNINFDDFETKVVKIKVNPADEGTYDIKVIVTKQNSGEFLKNIQVNIN